MARPAGFTIRHWSDDEIDLLKRLRAVKRSWKEIGAAVGRTGKAAREKWVLIREEIA